MKKLIPKPTEIQKSKNIVSCETGNAYHKNSKDNICYNTGTRYNLPYTYTTCCAFFFSLCNRILSLAYSCLCLRYSGSFS